MQTLNKKKERNLEAHNKYNVKERWLVNQKGSNNWVEQRREKKRKRWDYIAWLVIPYIIWNENCTLLIDVDNKLLKLLPNDPLFSLLRKICWKDPLNTLSCCKIRRKKTIFSRLYSHLQIQNCSYMMLKFFFNLYLLSKIYTA
jgi:hypothetical protein